MRVKAGSNLSKVRKENFTSIMGMIYQRGPITRKEIAERLGVTLPTVTTTIKQLLEDGVLLETELTEAEVSLGRKAMAVNIDQTHSYVMGVEWGPFGVISCITDLRGNIIARRKSLPEETSRDYEVCLQLTGQFAKELLEMAGISRAQVIGAGFTTPGMVSPVSGVLVQSSMDGVDWHEKPVREDLEARLGMPVCVENHVKARAIGQDLFQRKKRPGVYLYYFAQMGISCCVMVDGEPFGKGRYGTGDIGHTIMDIDGPVCSCGKQGCLQAFAGERALTELAAGLLQQGKAEILGRICENREQVTIEEVIMAVDCHDWELIEALKPAVRYMGISIANIVNLLNSELVVVDCALFNSPVLREYLSPMIPEYNIFRDDLEVTVEYIDANRYTGAQGACAVAVKELFIRQEEKGQEENRKNF